MSRKIVALVMILAMANIGAAGGVMAKQPNQLGPNVLVGDQRDDPDPFVFNVTATVLGGEASLDIIELKVPGGYGTPNNGTIEFGDLPPGTVATSDEYLEIEYNFAAHLGAVELWTDNEAIYNGEYEWTEQNPRPPDSPGEAPDFGSGLIADGAYNYIHKALLWRVFPNAFLGSGFYGAFEGHYGQENPPEPYTEIRAMDRMEDDPLNFDPPDFELWTPFYAQYGQYTCYNGVNYRKIVYPDSFASEPDDYCYLAPNNPEEEGGVKRDDAGTTDSGTCYVRFGADLRNTLAAFYRTATLTIRLYTE